ncbi:hypothetical protein TUM17383_36360 [Shewanella algae]|nr:hypothetical protein TUM17383_36360 [Shewanella algae]
MKITTIGLDIAKLVFHAVAVNKAGKLVRKKMLKRKEVLGFFAKLEPCLVAIEACGGAHYWNREITALGHQVKLLPPQYVIPYRQGNKNDYNDALAIAEAAQRPNMRFVPAKSIEQQDVQMLHRVRERLTQQTTALVNQVRGMLAEYGIVLAKGKTAFRSQLPDILEDGENALTAKGRAIFHGLYNEFVELENRLKGCEKQVLQENADNPICQRLGTVLGGWSCHCDGILCRCWGGEGISQWPPFFSLVRSGAQAAQQWRQG